MLTTLVAVDPIHFYFDVDERSVLQAMRQEHAEGKTGKPREVTIALADETEALRARNRTLQVRPDDVKAFFRAQLKRRVAPEPVARPRPALRTNPVDEPYGF